MTDDIEISIVAPMFNEADNVASTYQKLVATLKDFPLPWEIIFVNDGSTDNTWQIAKEIAAKDSRLEVLGYAHNQGRGKAMRTGFEAARGRYVVSIDFDLSYSPDHILRIYETMKQDPEIDIVFGSAYMEGGRSEGVSPSRIMISKAGNWVLNKVFPGNFKTITCILRGYRREVLQSLDLISNGKDIHLEILSKALALGCTIKEIPAVLKSRSQGKSSFGIKSFQQISQNHLAFALFEKPLIFFLLMGLIPFVLGLIGGLYIVYLRFAGLLNPERPLVNFVIILVLAGIQLISLGIIATQMVNLRREIFRLQSATRRLTARLRSKGII